MITTLGLLVGFVLVLSGSSKGHHHPWYYEGDPGDRPYHPDGDRPYHPEGLADTRFSHADPTPEYNPEDLTLEDPRETHNVGMLRHHGEGCKLDVQLLLDSSSSIDKDEWKKLIDAVRTDFLPSMEKSRVALTRFGSNVEHFRTLSQNVKPNDLVNGLDRLDMGNTHTGQALRETFAKFDQEARWSDPEVIKGLIVLADGNHNGNENVAEQAKLWTDKGVLIFAIGIGMVNMQGLKDISKTFAMVLDDFDELPDVIHNELLGEVCITPTGWPYVEDCFKDPRCICKNFDLKHECQFDEDGIPRMKITVLQSVVSGLHVDRGDVGIGRKDLCKAKLQPMTGSKMEAFVRSDECGTQHECGKSTDKWISYYNEVDLYVYRGEGQSKKIVNGCQFNLTCKYEREEKASANYKVLWRTGQRKAFRDVCMRLDLFQNSSFCPQPMFKDRPTGIDLGSCLIWFPNEHTCCEKRYLPVKVCLKEDVFVQGHVCLANHPGYELLFDTCWLAQHNGTNIAGSVIVKDGKFTALGIEAGGQWWPDQNDRSLARMSFHSLFDIIPERSNKGNDCIMTIKCTMVLCRTRGPEIWSKCQTCLHNAATPFSNPPASSGGGGFEKQQLNIPAGRRKRFAPRPAGMFEDGHAVGTAEVRFLYHPGPRE